MNKIISIFKNKEIMARIFFMIMVFLIIRICAATTVPGVEVSDQIAKNIQKSTAIGLMDLLGGGTLEQFSIVALGVSPYITAQIIIQLLSKDILPVLTNLSKEGEYGRRKRELATRYLTLLLGVVQTYTLIRTLENSKSISFERIGYSFWSYSYVIIIILAGSMLMMWLGDQITLKGLGNGISSIILGGCIIKLPIQIKMAFKAWITANRGHGAYEFFKGNLKFFSYILVFISIIIFVTFIELSKRKIPVQHVGRSNKILTNENDTSTLSYLPIKINPVGITPVIFASSFISTPSMFANLISAEAAQSWWLKIFSYDEFIIIKGFKVPIGLFLYLILIITFCFFYANIQIEPDKLAENFQKNGSYIHGVRPGINTANYISKVLNSITFLGSNALAFIAGFPIVLTLLKVFSNDYFQSLSLGGTSLIIIVGVAMEINDQINGLLAMNVFENSSSIAEIIERKY